MSGERVEFRVGDLACCCIAGLADELRRLYGEAAWAWNALLRRPGATLVAGRRPLVAAELGGVPLLVKRLHHGGALAPLTGDRFLTARRVIAAMRTADALASLGVATPEVLHVAWRRRAGFVRAELSVRREPGARDAAELLFADGRLPSGWEATAAAVGALAARLHGHGVLHGDLNLKNFLVTVESGLMILDLDKVALRRRLSRAARARNLARLERSVRKQGRALPSDTVAAVVAAVRRGYAADA